MFRLDNYMEQWAKEYIPLSHTEEDPSFFRMNDIFSLDEFLQNYHQLNKPVCGIVTHIKAKINVSKRVERPTYECVFLANADERDFKAQADAKEKAWNLMWAFLVKLDEDKKKEASEGKRSALANLNLEDLDADTIGPIANGWFQVNLSIETNNQNKICYNEEDYNTNPY